MLPRLLGYFQLATNIDSSMRTGAEDIDPSSAMGVAPSLAQLTPWETLTRALGLGNGAPPSAGPGCGPPKSWPERSPCVMWHVGTKALFHPVEAGQAIC